jgi:hypothetical protein
MLKNSEKLIEIAKEIREIISQRQKEYDLSFIEDTHTYYMRDLRGDMRSDYPSVSTVIKQFYNEFPDLEKSLEMSDGDIVKQDELLKQWRATADYANSIGSRTHFLLETDLLKLYGSYKDVRLPIFNCNEEQLNKSDKMIDGGHKFIQLMHRRRAVLLDTEMVLGSPELGYTGQPDKMWIIENEQGEIGFTCTDWKSNKPKNFEVQPYTRPMLPPFDDYMDTALSHYMIQLPLYCRLLLDMLKNTKYSDMKVFGCIIVHLLDDGRFVEYRIPKTFMNIVFTMDPLMRIDEIKRNKKIYEQKERDRLKMLNELINNQ